jgi:hypothetical protein
METPQKYGPTLRTSGKFACLAALFLVMAAGCGGPEPKRIKSGAHKALEAPVLADGAATLDPAATLPALLWNGWIGLRLGRDGTGFGPEGSALPLFHVDEYERDGEEKIRPLPHPFAIRIEAEGVPLRPVGGTEYRQELSFAIGALVTKWRQKVAGANLEIVTVAVLHPDRPIAGMGIAVGTDQAISLDLTVQFGGAGAAQPKPAIPEDQVGRQTYFLSPKGTRAAVLNSLRASGMRGMTQWSTRASGTWRIQAAPEEPLTFERVVAFGRRSQPEPPEMPTLEQLEKAAFEHFGAPHAPDIEIEGPAEDQQAVRSFLFYLRTAIHPEAGMSVAPMGLSSTQYNGHVFWDADIWVFPAMALLEPKRAAAISRYRIERAEQAARNFRKWLEQGRPTGQGKLGPAPAFATESGKKFPWESSVTGKETVPGPSRFQDHITASVVFSLDQAAALGLIPGQEAAQVAQGAAGFYRARIEKVHDVGHLRGTMSPDENHIGNNDLYTNLLAQWLFQGRSYRSDPGIIRMKLPQDGRTFLTYENDALRSYKQAAAVLAIFPLQYPEAEKQARQMMERFEGKVARNGPAMSDSIHATIWARLGEAEKAYEAWRKSWVEFADHPLLLFAEKRQMSSAQLAAERTYFTTGAAGSLNAVLYGFLGFRLDEKAQPGAAWSKPLRNGGVLSLKPNLPKAWKKVILRNFTVLGESYTVEATREGARVLPAR